MLLEAGDDAKLIPLFDELMLYLDLITIYISPVWRWMLLFGYSCDQNKKCYCIDGHVMPDMGAHKNDRFLLEYFGQKNLQIDEYN